VRAEEELREAQEQFAAFMDQLPGGALIKEQDSRVVYANQYMKDMFGSASWSGKRADEYLPKELAGRVLLDDRKALEKGSRKIVETVLDKEGIEHVYRTHKFSILREGKPRRLGTIALDITDLKRAQEEREKLIDELDAFAHTVAHGLKNPLLSILGLADLLMSDRATMPDEELEGSLRTVAQTADKMGNIVEELMLLADVRRADEVEIGPLDMASIVAEAQERLGYMIEKHGAEIVLPETWPVALGYGPWVEEMWINYLGNAIEYGGQPPSVELGAAEQADGMVRFWVRDNGLGIAPEDQAHLFTPFTQLRQVHTAGHGLGLSIVRRIVDRLGGKVGVESELGQGSEFYFTLRAAKR
jgi:PAS domain S-box-containing protein